jgi:Flp pilus assembly CpaF family ATPase
MENQNVQDLADKIARLLQSEKQNSDSPFLHASLEKISQRLDKIESQIAFQNPKFQIQNPKSNHSSQEKFTSLEELAEEAINGLQNEKACPFEPTGKPCDYCAMCNSRGF